jgi:hypothetical protein
MTRFHYIPVEDVQIDLEEWRDDFEEEYGYDNIKDMLVDAITVFEHFANPAAENGSPAWLAWQLMHQTKRMCL